MGDIPGKFTFLNSNMKSTIDQVWANLITLENIYSFSAVPVLSNSFHSLCTIKLGSTRNSIATNNSSQQNKIFYMPKFQFNVVNNQAYIN